jgi:hypothetical protein
MAEPIIDLIEKEFEQVGKEREALLAKRTEIDDQLRALDIRLRAAANYKATLEGKFRDPAAHAEPKARAPSTRARRGARGELRKKIIDLLRRGSLNAKEINQELQASDKKATQQIANVLSSMKATGALTQEARGGPYTLAPTRPEAT